MSPFYLSSHPIYRNTPWPYSYLLHPLSTVHTKPACLISYSYKLLSEPDETARFNIFDWLEARADQSTAYWASDRLPFSPVTTTYLILSKLSPAVLRQLSSPIPPLKPVNQPIRSLQKVLMKANAKTETSTALQDATAPTTDLRTIKSVHNPMIIKQSAACVNAAKRVKCSVPAPSFSRR